MRINLEQAIRLAKAHHLEAPLATEGSFERFLKFWWCQTYSRPLKDPLLANYTMDELAYEFFRHFYTKEENDPRKEIQAKKSSKEDEDWIKRELAQLNAAQAKIQEAVAATEKITKEMLPEAEDISIKFPE